MRKAIGATERAATLPGTADMKAALACGKILPMALYGAAVAPVPRKPRQPVSLDKSQGVLCADTCAKILGRVLRTEAVPALVTAALPLQCL